MECAGGVLRIVIVLAMMATLACGRKDPVDVLMGDLEEAAENRDADAIEKRLAAGFTGYEGLSREETLARLKSYFAAYKQIHVDVTQVERSNSGDRVSFRVDFSGQPNTAFGLQNLLPTTAAYSFELRFVEEGGTLKVKQALWQQI